MGSDWSWTLTLPTGTVAPVRRGHPARCCRLRTPGPRAARFRALHRPMAVIEPLPDPAAVDSLGREYRNALATGPDPARAERRFPGV
ncbi:hypothetical protein ABJI51_34120 [Amycolatopsis sp. NEAU-NG30]|uniref:Uncharacterized protein n=1 Tax=Amycolatopsis melonis TaxID=3156488 RepID=A0ABV0LPA6_9PSEU